MSRPSRVPAEDPEEPLESPLDRGSPWAATYGSAMSCLMLFFMILYASSATRGAAVQAGAKAVDPRLAGGAQALEQLFSRYGTQIGRVELGESRIRISLPTAALFESNSAYLKSDCMPMLQELFKILSGMPNAVQIEGHTDDRPQMPGSKFDSNAELSSARAFAVLRFLEISGISEERLSAIGFGDLRPQQSNATPEGRAANRRIDVVISRREN